MMLNEARKVMFTHPGMMMTTGVAIVIIVMAFNFYQMLYKWRLILVCPLKKTTGSEEGVKARDTA